MRTTVASLIKDDTIFKQMCSQLGLTSLQGKIILELLKRGGESTVPELSTSLDDNRTTLYSGLNQLKKLNLVIESKETSKQTSYSIMHTSINLIIQKLVQPRDNAISDFKKLLLQAKASQIQNQDYFMDYFSLKGKKKLMNQIQSVIADSNEYMLIQANTTMLDLIFPWIAEKQIQRPELRIFIQITWNPDPKRFNMKTMIERYQKIIGQDHIVPPHPGYDRLLGGLLYSEDDIIQQIPVKYHSVLKNRPTVYFIQVLSDQGSVMGVHFGGTEGGGHFTRDIFTTQAFHNIFFIIFEMSLGKQIDDGILKNIMIKIVSRNLLKIAQVSNH